MTIHCYFTVIAGRGDRALVERYLYGHTTIREFQESDGHFVGVLRTEQRTDTDASYSANYQAARLSSGGIAAKVLGREPNHGDLADAADPWESSRERYREQARAAK